MNPNHHEIGVGATGALHLRVSVAALVSVLFVDPENGRTMLALERTATLRETEGRREVTVRAKPFGGGVRLINPRRLKDLIGQFHYDSERSRREDDFRIQIHPASWDKVKEICREHLKAPASGILDASPARELAEEFEDALQVQITPDQYQLKPRGMIVENLPEKTDNVRAAGLPTVRIYYLFDARISAPEMITLLLANSRRYSDRNLQQMAWDDYWQGGKGRANAALALDLQDLIAVYRSIPLHRRYRPRQVGKYQLDGNVPAILALE